MKTMSIYSWTILICSNMFLVACSVDELKEDDLFDIADEANQSGYFSWEVNGDEYLIESNNWPSSQVLAIASNDEPDEPIGRLDLQAISTEPLNGGSYDSFLGVTSIKYTPEDVPFTIDQFYPGFFLFPNSSQDTSLTTQELVDFLESESFISAMLPGNYDPDFGLLGYRIDSDHAEDIIESGYITIDEFDIEEEYMSGTFAAQYRDSLGNVTVSIENGVFNRIPIYFE